MDDLAGLNFSTNTQPKSTTNKPLQNTTYAAPIPSRGISPNYSISSPRVGADVKTLNSGNGKVSTKPDSFASLSAFSGIKVSQTSNASLEQQRLAREKQKKEALKKEKKNMEMHFNDDGFWDKHSRTNTPAPTQSYFPC
jgi:hypothetical protein